MPPGRAFRLGLSAASRDSLRLARRVASIGEANMSDLRVARTVRSPFFVAELLSPSGLPTARMARPFVQRMLLRSTCRDFERRSRAQLSGPIRTSQRAFGVGSKLHRSERQLSGHAFLEPRCRGVNFGMGEIQHHLRFPGWRIPLANANKKWVPIVSTWCRVLSIHSIIRPT